VSWLITVISIVLREERLLLWLFSFWNCCIKFIKQVQLLKVFPLRYWGTMLSCVIAAIQSGIAGVCIDSSKAAWRLEWNLQLLTIIYSVIYSLQYLKSMKHMNEWRWSLVLKCDEHSEVIVYLFREHWPLLLHSAYYHGLLQSKDLLILQCSIPSLLFLWPF